MMKLVRVTSVAVPLLRENIDTDAIIPSREMRTVSKTGLADGLFAGWRYRSIGERERDPGFVLNADRYRGARILIGGANFGCGSSREHAVWALAEYGFQAVLAPSFSPIFEANCVRNGVVPVVLPGGVIARLGALSAVAEPVAVAVDLETMTVGAGAESWAFVLDAEWRSMLMEGLDGIDLTLKHAGRIEAFRKEDAGRRPWAYLGGEIYVGTPQS
jgi:3-isopropylmalate/(R)-2-methylmalate dehydratase small subunit